MDSSRILSAAEGWVKRQLEGDSSGHDWWHVVRVRRLARRLALETDANYFICELAALLHDLADEKLIRDEEAGLRTISNWLAEQGLSKAESDHILDIISTMSFKGGGGRPMGTLEGQVVQDADRLDALGAVGIARTFAYSGWKGRPMHDPSLPPRLVMSKEQYRKEKSTATNHFHEKLLKLKELMNTEPAIQIAEERHRYMEEFLRRFEAEWDGTDA